MSNNFQHMQTACIHRNVVFSDKVKPAAAAGIVVLVIYDTTKRTDRLKSAG